MLPLKNSRPAVNRVHRLKVTSRGGGERNGDKYPPKMLTNNNNQHKNLVCIQCSNMYNLILQITKTARMAHLIQNCGAGWNCIFSLVTKLHISGGDVWRSW